MIMCANNRKQNGVPCAYEGRILEQSRKEWEERKERNRKKDRLGES